MVITAEKSVILDSDPRRGLPDQGAERRFRFGVARIFGRYAFPDDLSESLRKFVARVKNKHGRASDEGRALRTVEEIRVTGSPSWEARQIDVFITFAPSTRPEADKVMTQDKWDRLVDGWLRSAEPTGVIRSVDGAMIPLDELSAREYLDSELLDFDHLSW